MTRLILAAVLASIAVAGAACTDDNPVAPSSISNPAAFRNELLFVPDPANACVSKAVPTHGKKPGTC
jgi:hypothetical protein